MPVAIYETEYGYALVTDFERFNRVVNSEIHPKPKTRIFIIRKDINHI